MAGQNDNRIKAGRAADPIAEALRRLHDEVAAEPVPQEFFDLLDQIDAKLGTDGPSGGGDEDSA